MQHGVLDSQSSFLCYHVNNKVTLLKNERGRSCVTTLLVYLISFQSRGSVHNPLDDNIHLFLWDTLLCHMKAICKPSFVSLLW